MITINEETKKRFREEAAELASLGLTYEEYTTIVETGNQWLEEVDAMLQGTVALNLYQKPAIAGLLAEHFGNMQYAVNYGYFLLAGCIPSEMQEDPELENSFHIHRRSFLLQLKRDIFPEKYKEKRKEDA